MNVSGITVLRAGADGMAEMRSIFDDGDPYIMAVGVRFATEGAAESFDELPTALGATQHDISRALASASTSGEQYTAAATPNATSLDTFDDTYGPEAYRHIMSLPAGHVAVEVDSRSSDRGPFVWQGAVDHAPAPFANALAAVHAIIPA